jgi:hypothetical protein
MNDDVEDLGYDSGSTEKASKATIERARQMLRDMYAPPK